jgi:hypothetical protein
MKKGYINIFLFLFLLLFSTNIKANGWSHKGGIKYHSFYRSHQYHYHQPFRFYFSIFAPTHKIVFIPAHWENNIFIPAHWERIKLY